MSRKYNAFWDVKVDMAEVQRRAQAEIRKENEAKIMRLPVLYVEAILAEYDDSADPRTPAQRDADEDAADYADTIASVRPY